MTPNELRLGNYVRIKDNGTIAKVERLSFKKAGFHYGNDKSRGYFRKYSEIEPVLIYDHRSDIDFCIMHSGWDDGDEKYLYYLPEYPHRTFRFIHELQNLHFALTGNEIEIEL